MLQPVTEKTFLDVFVEEGGGTLDVCTGRSEIIVNKIRGCIFFAQE